VTEHKVIVAGTDGSETSLRAVDKAATIAAETGATLIVPWAHADAHRRPSGPDPDQPKHEDYRTVGNAPVYRLLHDAAERAKKKGVSDVEERAINGAPAEAVIKLAEDAQAGLIVVMERATNHEGIDNSRRLGRSAGHATRRRCDWWIASDPNVPKSVPKANENGPRSVLRGPFLQ
jgi:nucleotide-binding universal stress UspA family protein